MKWSWTCSRLHGNFVTKGRRKEEWWEEKKRDLQKLSYVYVWLEID